jgi:RNA polymerase sigma factor (sigma-70 family)
LAGQIESFNEVFTRYYRRLVKWCGRRVPRGLADPEDIVHSAYLRCASQWSSARKSDYCEVNYLYRAVRWTMLDTIRGQTRRRLAHTSITPPCKPDTPPWARIALGEALSALQGRQRQVCLAMLDGKSRVQICEELELTSGALDVCIHRARHSLHDLLDLRQPVTATVRPAAGQRESGQTAP